MADTLSGQLGEFVAGLSFGEIPTEVTEHAKLDILDTLGCGLFGQSLPIAGILQKTFQDLDHAGGGTVWGSDWKATIDTAALINGTLTHSFELDDLHPRGILHPGGTALPAILALAERNRLSGEAVVEAHVCALEVACRVGLACGLDLLHRGWHNNGILGVFGATAGACRLLGLSAEETTQAFGTAGSLACGLIAAQYGSMVKRLHAGQAAQSGLRAALLAANGFTGIKNLFEADYGGFFSTFVDGSRPSELVETLGQSWETLNVGFKLYPACGSSHTTVNALEDLIAEHGFGAGDVQKVDVHSSTATHLHVGWAYVPDSATTAQMNLPYAAAQTILKGKLSVAEFTDEAIRGEAVRELADRIATIPEAEIDAGGRDHRHEVWVDVQLRDGQVLSKRVTNAPGSPSRPAPPGTVVAKFMDLASRTLPVEQCEIVAREVKALEASPNLSGLLVALAKHERAVS